MSHHVVSTEVIFGTTRERFAATTTEETDVGKLLEKAFLVVTVAFSTYVLGIVVTSVLWW
jgi:hypothetical protein